VIAVDADPDGNLAAALGVPEAELPSPIAQMRDLVLQRTEAKDEGAGLMFKLNPKVDDIPQQFAVDADGVKLLILGSVELGGKGCMCPESTVLKALMQHLLLRISDDVILDMEAGLEHIGRASARGVDAMITVVEPGMRSVQTAARINRLAKGIGIARTLVVANKIRQTRELDVLRRALDRQIILGTLPYNAELARADLEGRPLGMEDRSWAEAVEQIVRAIQEQVDSPATGVQATGPLS
jgi:CO dehydrogenase maturation factor